MHSLISFTSYTASYITNLDNSVHTFHPSPSSTFLRTLPTSLHLECCATPFMLPFQRRNAHSHISFFNSSHIINSLRSASMRLSDKRSLHSSIPHHTAVQPALGTKSYHCSQIPFIFLNLLIGVWAEMPRSQWIAVCIHSIKKWSAHHPMDCKRVWLHSTRDSQHLTGVWAICDARRMGGIFAFINFTLWTQSILLVYRTLQSGRSCDESVARAECDECEERHEHGEVMKEKRQRGWSPSLNRWCVLEDVQSLPPSGNRWNERITHRAGAEGIDCLHFVHQGLESG